MDGRIYCCEDCMHCRYDDCIQEYFCRRFYTEVYPEGFACDDFELDDWGED